MKHTLCCLHSSISPAGEEEECGGVRLQLCSMVPHVAMHGVVAIKSTPIKKLQFPLFDSRFMTFSSCQEISRYFVNNDCTITIQNVVKFTHNSEKSFVSGLLCTQKPKNVLKNYKNFSFKKPTFSSRGSKRVLFLLLPPVSNSGGIFVARVHAAENVYFAVH